MTVTNELEIIIAIRMKICLQQTYFQPAAGVPTERSKCKPHQRSSIYQLTPGVSLADTVKDRYTQGIATLGRECREWPECLTDAAIHSLIEENCRPDEIIIYTDGSVLRGEQSGWAYNAARHYITIHEGSGATNLTRV